MSIENGMQGYLISKLIQARDICKKSLTVSGDVKQEKARLKAVSNLCDCYNHLFGDSIDINLYADIISPKALINDMEDICWAYKIQKSRKETYRGLLLFVIAIVVAFSLGIIPF